ncbi:MAG: Copper chaperone CopZ [Calditrichaeota bacterium]|nr:Copper chaperone CopZ [Calditrichota bacterium]
MADVQKRFHVRGMTCAGCAKLVGTILKEDVAGVKEAEVSLDEGIVNLTYDDENTDLEAAAGALQENGYRLVLR